MVFPNFEENHEKFNFERTICAKWRSSLHLLISTSDKTVIINESSHVKLMKANKIVHINCISFCIRFLPFLICFNSVGDNMELTCESNF